MKTILVPTDYSDVAYNALQYAVELSKLSNAKIILMHAYQVPVQTVEVPVVMVSPQELEKENQEMIRELKNKAIEQADGKVEVELLVRAGFAVDQIMDVIKEKKADLVVMGITGRGKISEALIGSHTSALIKKTQTPVLVIPKEARYKEIKKIVLAYDYSDIVNVASLERFKKFVKLFQAKVLVLDVEKPVAVPVYENTVAGETLEKSLKGVDYVMFFSSAEDRIEEINSFADAHQCNWIAMIPHKHNLLNRLFHKSNTKRMAFHTHIPLLSIHD